MTIQAVLGSGLELEAANAGTRLEVLVARCGESACELDDGQPLRFEEGRVAEEGCVEACALGFTPERPRMTLWLTDGWYALAARAYQGDQPQAAHCGQREFEVGFGLPDTVTLSMEACLAEVRFTQVSAGGYHSLALDERGNVWVWGSGSDGRLGTGRAQEAAPVMVLNAEHLGEGVVIEQVAAGTEFSVALDSEGNVWGWGRNEVGQLASPTPSTIASATLIVTPDQLGGSPVVSVSAGRHVLALTSEGVVWAWGRGGSGQIGDGASSSRAAPTKASSLLSDVSFVMVAAGHYHSLALDDNGQVWAWGSAQYGQIGDGHHPGRPHQTTGKRLEVDDEGDDVVFVSIAAGDQISLALEDDGDVWAWGRGVADVLGDGPEFAHPQFHAWSPTKVAFAGLEDGVRIESIAVGRDHAFAVDSLGSVWAWGQDGFGQLGTGGGVSDERLPVRLALEPGVAFATVSAGGYFQHPAGPSYSHTLAVDDTGNLWVWGRGAESQLGTGSASNEHAPVALTVQAPP